MDFAILTQMFMTAGAVFTAEAGKAMAGEAGKQAHDWLKSRFGSKDMTDPQAVAEVVQAEPDKAAFAEKVETLRQALLSLPAETQAQYAIDNSTFEALGPITAERIEGGIRDSSFTSHEGGISLGTVTAPK